MLSDLIQTILRSMREHNVQIKDSWVAGCRGIHPGWRPSQGA